MSCGERPTAKAPKVPASKLAESFKNHMARKKIMPNLDSLVTSVKGLMDENESLRQELREYDKDTEIQKLKLAIHNMRLHSISIMSELEKDRADVFASHHAVSCNSGIQYIVFGTGIGTNTKVKCRKCQEEQDITDYEGW